ncbi:DUF499 domain-containing protein [Azospirillum sp. RWY-5-1]|uniref:DUF499 domain-containing protein n=1 Tax=Azospirillum oleiclasticum TaxID=2735135 RepID=A0ABX2TF82_9PROT|nr:DUF499 domain-containing protein [Azospirillum oleiclasticum]NYZ16881.1 DUF499 domain-containing protein [Azospirillum oleiclasticum]NYZ21818.1 DUF499 domain-containing protein [Azospirillum oleiclasticum]
MSNEIETRKRLAEAEFVLAKALAPFVGRHMEAKFGRGWRMYASRAKGGDPKGDLDLYGLLLTLIQNWNEVFKDHLPLQARVFAYGARDGRNAVAHAARPVEVRDALRYIDAYLELARAVKAPDEVARLKALWEAERTAGPAAAPEAAAAPQPAAPPAETAETDRPAGFEEGPHRGSRQAAMTLEASDTDGSVRLEPWRTVAFPRVDVLENRFTDAEFAANLTAVIAGSAAEEYATARAFFQMTLPTNGLLRALRSVYERLTGAGGEPVIGLQTGFGGGKTHSLLALYHMAGLTAPAELPVLSEVVRTASKGQWDWKPARVAVFVGTDRGPDVPLVREGGHTVRTVWGSLAWQLLREEGLAIVAEAEAAGSSPGSVTLEEVMRRAAPCLILLDEVTAYVRQLTGPRYESHLSFCQELTEAAARVPGVAVVASLPETKEEAGAEKGLETLIRLEKIFGRIQSPLLPASGDETMVIVTHRLFAALDPRSEKAREQTIKAFHDLYRRNRGEFPPRVSEPAYLEELRRCYPFHPELLSRLAKDWSGFQKFHRTRGVLKLLAKVVTTLWDEERQDPLILPAHVPIRNDRVRATLMEPLDPSYGAVIDREVDGNGALPAQMEANPTRNIARARAATRVARALFICSVPTAQQATKGITGPSIRLACAMPGDQLDVFGNALREYAERAAFLYEDSGRYWLSPQPTVNKLAEDRARALSVDEVDAEIVRLLREDGKPRRAFARVHAAPDDPAEVDDTPELGLVILGPAHPHAGRGAADSAATRMVEDTLLRRGQTQRLRRNTLVFLAPDIGALETARSAVRKALAWRGIVRDAQDNVLPLTATQERDAKEKDRNGALGAQKAVRSAWIHGFYPHKDLDAGADRKPFELEHVAVRPGDQPLHVAAFEKFKGEAIQEKLGAKNLTGLLRRLWPEDAPHLSVAQVASWFAEYVYLPRLRDRAVLAEAINAGVALTGEESLFALARLDGSGAGYRDVTFRPAITVSFDADSVLLRRGLAETLVPSPAQPLTAPSFAAPSFAATPGTAAPLAKPPNGTIAATDAVVADKAKTRFFASLDLDPVRWVAKVPQVAQGVVSELARPDGARIRITLEIHADAPHGFPGDVMSIVRDNLRDLGFSVDSGRFEEE